MPANELSRPGSKHQVAADPKPRFADACGMSGVVRLIIRHLETDELTKIDLDEPFALIGRSASCQIQLSHPEVSKKHAYIQILDGRVHCFDLGSRTGIRFRDRPRTEAILAGADSLVIGPFEFRLSQAPAYGIGADDAEHDPVSSTSGDRHLVFWNADDETSPRTTSQLQRKITLIGRSGCCHITLADESLARVQCSVVRTTIGDWIVNLHPENPARLGGKAIECEPLSGDESLEIGPLRMQFVGGSAYSALDPSEEDLVAELVAREPACIPDEEDEHMEIPALPLSRPPQLRQRQYADSSGATSDDVLCAAIERFGEMQQQILSQSHERSMALAQVVASIQKKQRTTIHQQIDRIRTATSSLAASNRPKLEVVSDPQAEDQDPAGSPSATE